MWRIIDTPESSNIRKIAYNPVTLTLRVIFKSNDAYEYAKVPNQVAGELMASPSVGSVFSRLIRNHYEFVKYQGGTIDQDEVSPV